MKTIGLTGSIGSGKTTVSGIIESIGYPVFNSDFVAKEQLATKAVINKIVDKFGVNILSSNQTINKNELSRIVFSNKNNLNYLNSVIHPLVFDEFEQWKKRFNTKLVFMESAIIFEQKFENMFDQIICVWAPAELCINRCLQRDKTSIKDIKARLSNQMSSDYKREKSDFVVINDEIKPILPQILNIIHEILKK